MSRSSDEITINIKELIDEFGADDISIALEEFMKKHIYALPENGAPEMISCELHNCPFYEKKQNIKNWEDYK